MSLISIFLRSMNISFGEDLKQNKEMELILKGKDNKGEAKFQIMQILELSMALKQLICSMK